MTEPEPAPADIEPNTPSVARVYDYFLGGKINFAVDREVAAALSTVHPNGPAMGRQNRAFLRQAVRYLAGEAGIRQFLDLGSGLPTQGNVHQIAQQIDPAAKVVYVDHDPVVLVHAQALLADSPTATALTADVRRPAELLTSPGVTNFLDLTQPVGLLAFGILHHFNDDEDPAGIAATLRDAVVSGSYLAISHFHNPGDTHPEAATEAERSERIFREKLGTGRFRTRAELLAYFGEWELVSPGLTYLGDWRPEPDAETVPRTRAYYTMLGGVARKP